MGQINIGKKQEAQGRLDNNGSEMHELIQKHHLDAVLIQEPNSNKIINGKTYAAAEGGSKPRASIWLSDEIVRSCSPIMLNNFSNRDVTAVRLRQQGEVKSDIILASVYLPTNDQEKRYITSPIDDEHALARLALFCNLKGLRMIAGGDFNSKIKRGGSIVDDQRGKNVLNFINYSDLQIMNEGRSPTFRRLNSVRNTVSESVIDFTLCSSDMAPAIRKWSSSFSDSLADHALITFEIQEPVAMIKPPKNKKHINFSKLKTAANKGFTEIEAQQGWTWDAKDTEELDQKIKSFNSLMMNACESAMGEPSRRKKNYQWFTAELKEKRKLMHASREQMLRAIKAGAAPPEAMLLKGNFNKLRNNYYREIRSAKSESYKSYLESLEKLSDVARMQKIFENGENIEIGCIRRECGELAEDVDTITDTLIEKHSPGATKILNPMASTTLTRNYDTDSEGTIDELVSEESVKRIWKEMGQFKAAGVDGIFPALLHNTECISSRPARDIIRSSFKLGSCANEWNTSLMIFLPKPAREDYRDPKSFRPISLTPCLKKTAERLINNYVTRVVCGNKPFTSNQHAFAAGSSCDSAIHALLSQIELELAKSHSARALDGTTSTNKGMVLTLFLDLQGAFDNVGYSAVNQALDDINAPRWATDWIMSSLKNRVIVSSLNDKKSKYLPAKGVPQGSVISPLIFNLVMNGILTILNEKNCFGAEVTKAICFADDVTILIPVNMRDPSSTFKKMNRKLAELSNWCREKGLILNASKTNFMIFNKNKKLADNLVANNKIIFEGKEISRVESTKYLGITLDENLSWKEHLSIKHRSGLRTLAATQRMTGKRFGVSPFLTMWIFRQIVIPRILYGCFSWWRDDRPRRAERLEPVKNLALRITTGAMKGTSTVVMQTILGAAPIQSTARELTLGAIARLKMNDRWTADDRDRGPDSHAKNLALLEPEAIPSNPDKTNLSNPFWTSTTIRRWNAGVCCHPDYCTYVMEDWRKRKNLIWIVVHNIISPLIFEKEAPSSDKIGEAIRIAIELNRKFGTGKNLNIFCNNGDAIKALSSEKFRSHAKVKLWQEANDSRKTNLTIKLRVCPPFTGIKMFDAVRAKIDRTALPQITKISLQASIGSLKAKLKIRTRDDESRIWSRFIEALEAKGDQITLSKPRRTLRDLKYRERKEILNLNRSDLRTLTSFYAGRALDNRFLSNYEEEYIECMFCGSPRNNQMSHWALDCQFFNTSKLLIMSNHRHSDPRAVPPLLWLEFLNLTGLNATNFLTWDEALPEILEKVNKIETGRLHTVPVQQPDQDARR